MLQSKLNIRNVRSALLLGAATAAAMGFSVAAASADESGVETVVVTGSRIPQQGLYASSPVTSIGQQEIKLEGTTSLDTLINSLPGAFADYNAVSSAFSGALGTASVDLRGLGSSRTLVLVDGRRLMPGDPIIPVPDINQIPAALVDHIEVLTGGASAVYGSDALAGVVNFVMRKDFQGVELDGQWSDNYASNDGSLDGNSFASLDAAVATPPAPKDWWGGGTGDATLILGANSSDGKGNVTGWVGYRHVEPVIGSQRDFANCTLGTDVPSQTITCQGSSNLNRWISFDNLFANIGNDALPPDDQPDTNCTVYAGCTPYDFFETGSGASNTGQFAPYANPDNSVDPSHKFNFGAPAYIQQPSTRYTAGFDAHYEVDKALDVYSNFMFADTYGQTLLSPSAVFEASGPAFLPGTISPGYQQVNCGNPLMTAQENVALCGQNNGFGPPPTFVANANFPAGGYWDGSGNLTPGQSLLYIGRRDVEDGPRVYDTEHTGYRAVIGAKGDLGSGWTYDIYAQYGRTTFQQHETHALSVSRVENALQVDPDTGQCMVTKLGIDPNCVPLDIFNGLGSITPEMLGYSGFSGFELGVNEEQIVSGSLTGDLGEWGVQSPWAKNPVAISVGSEWRAEYLKFDTDYGYQHADEYGTGKILPVPRSGFEVAEVFGEIRVPLVQDQEMFEDLSLNAGYRYSSYSSVGAVHSYKYGAEWQPIDDIRFRASYQRAVRAPNVLELFSPANVTLFSGKDPCAASAAGQCATVNNAGNANLLTCPAAQCNTELGGNPNLQPETSDTKSFGLVFTPTFLDGFSATVDYFDIKVANYVSHIGATTILSGCYSDGASAAAIAFYCPLVVRNGTGAIFGAGYVADINRNLPYLSTKGVDFEANYQADLDDWGMQGSGSLAFNFIGTYLENLQTSPSPVADPKFYDCAGLFGITCGTPSPHWRHKFRVTWSTPWDVDLSLSWRHIGSTNLDANVTNPLLGGTASTVCPGGGVIHGVGDCVDRKITAYDYFDISADWTVTQGADIRVGVTNLFEKQPPVLDQGSLGVTPIPFGAANTFPGTYDSLGRTIFVGGTVKL